MAQFSVNTHRFDPYKNFKFRIKWDGRYVAGVSKVGALKRTTEVVEHREGGDPSTSRKSPGRTKYEAITLELFDPTANAQFAGDAAVSRAFGIIQDNDGAGADLAICVALASAFVGRQSSCTLARPDNAWMSGS